MYAKITAVGAVLVLLGGCAQVEESAVYKPEDMNRLESYRLVKVVHAEEVKIDPETPGIVGAGVGATGGGLIGSQVGGNGAIVGLAVLGGLIGYAIEQQATDTTATRYVIDMDGAQKVIVQKDSQEPLQPGDTAMMIGDYQPRLVKAPPEIIDSARQTGGSGSVKVNEETGVIVFDEELESSGGGESKSEGETIVWEEEGGGWTEPTNDDWSEPQGQQ